MLGRTHGTPSDRAQEGIPDLKTQWEWGGGLRGWPSQYERIPSLLFWFMLARFRAPSEDSPWEVGVKGRNQALLGP